ncbi:MAG: diacylglycerol kinase [Arenimonas sp.]
MADSTESQSAPRNVFQIINAFKWSMKGLKAAWDYESSFRLEVYLFVIMAPLGFWLGATGVEKALLVSSLILVLIVEVINSAIEAVVDRFGGEHHVLSGRAKDLGSASVFLADIIVLLCWACILGPRFMAWVNS